MKLGMFDPVSSSIDGKRKVLNALLVDLIIYRKEHTQGRLCEDRVCGMGKDVVSGKVAPGIGKAFRYQVFLDREM